MNVYLASVSLMAIAGLPTAAAALPVLHPAAIHIAQNAGTPAASIDPDRPIQIEVVNAGGAAVISRLTQPSSDDRRVAPGSSVTFGTTHTSYLPLPLNLLVAPEAENIGLSLYVTAENNVVRVVVAAARSDIPGSTSVRIAPDGGVYVY